LRVLMVFEDKEKEKEVSTEESYPLWFIDLDWLKQNARSFLPLAQAALCPKCLKQLGEGEGGPSVDGLLSSIRDCCSKTPEFITPNVPILESVFRLFLANGNRPLDLEELGKQLSERRGAFRTSAEVLFRLLSSDQYYGIKPVSG